ncbi:transposase [Pseudanabaena sp. FACHB-1998]|nr:transposase [Pseudanabaena sp. FACHB-1998]
MSIPISVANFCRGCFQIFLDLVSEKFADSIIIMQVDQAGCHRAKRLRLPSNIIFIFQPAHSPQLNPIERVWLHLKQGLRFALPKNMNELQLFVTIRLSEMSKSVIASLVGWLSILDALSVASIL